MPLLSSRSNRFGKTDPSACAFVAWHQVKTAPAFPASPDFSVSWPWRDNPVSDLDIISRQEKSGPVGCVGNYVVRLRVWPSRRRRRDLLQPAVARFDAPGPDHHDLHDDEAD